MRQRLFMEPNGTLTGKRYLGRAAGHADDAVLPFYVLLFYAFVEYARPEFLAVMRPALIAQAMILWFLLARRVQVLRILREPYFKAFVLLLALMALHTFWAVNNYWAFIYFRTVLTYLVVSVAICIFLDTPEKISRFLLFLVAVLALCAIDRLVGVGTFGASGPMQDENDFALAMNMALPISFFLSRSATSWRKFLLLGASLLFVLGNVASASRGGFLGLAAAGGYCWLFSRHKARSVVVLLVFAMLGWNFASPEFKSEVTAIGIHSAESGTGLDRIELWKVGWRAFVDNPLFGVGQGNMPIVMESYQYDEHGMSYWKRGLWGRAIHSVYFTILPELGLVGTFLLLLMCRALACRVKMTKLAEISTRLENPVNEIRNLTLGLWGSLLAFLVTGFFLSASYYPEFWNISALLLAVPLALANAGNEHDEKGLTGKKPLAWELKPKGVGNE